MKTRLCAGISMLVLVTAFYGATPAAGSATAVTFSGVTSYESAGPFPFTVAVADLNRDSNQDLAVVNSGFPSSVSILLGNGSGGFGPATAYPTGGDFSHSVAVGDVNNDGNPDVAVTNINSNTVSVLLGDGHGGLGTPATFSTGTSRDLAPSALAIGDLNGDGKPDLAVANQNAFSVSVLLGDGTGSFGPATEYPIPGPFSPSSVKIADLNRDGRLDLVVGDYNFGGLIAVLLGDGVGGFGSPAIYSSGANNVFSLALDDLNGDGNPDLVVGAASPSVSVLLGNGIGGFGLPTSYPLAGGFGATLSVDAADLNGDGKTDLVATGGNSDVSVWLGDGAGGFGASTRYGFCTCSSPSALATGDLNHDGLPDIVGANDDFNGLSGTVAVALNTTGQGADLSITKSGAPNPLVSGNRLTYTLVATDNGSEPATGVSVIDPLPARVHFRSVSSSQGSCTRSTGQSGGKDGTVTCSLGGLANGAAATITIVVTTTTPGTLTNTATVSGNEMDPNPSNNDATAATTVLGN
ncbi:MAG TPA: FG-GAP-like repeat-containing protein [Gaiellaceae bacterium]